MSLYPNKIQVDGVPCGLILRGSANGTYLAEQIDWSRPAVVGESPLPAGYGFQVRDIRYAHATRSYTVLLQTAEQYLGDVAGFQAQLGELEETLQEKQALLQEQESMIAALEQAGSAAQLRSELEDAYQKGVELCG